MLNKILVLTKKLFMVDDVVVLIALVVLDDALLEMQVFYICDLSNWASSIRSWFLTVKQELCTKVT